MTWKPALTPEQAKAPNTFDISEISDIAGRFDINNDEAKRIARTVKTEDRFITVWEQEDWWTDDMAISAQCLNEAGQQHVKNEINRLGLNWDVSATITEIEEKMHSLPEKFGRDNDSFDFEISNNTASISKVCQAGYGVFAYIEITSDMVRFEDTTI